MQNRIRWQGVRPTLNKRDDSSTYLLKEEGIVIKQIGFIITVLLMLSGCSAAENDIHIHNNADVDEQKAEQLIENDERIRNATMVFHEDYIFAGITVGTFSRFNKKKIEKELKKKLEKAYEEAEVLVSADHKFVMETNKLAHMTEDDELSKEIKKLKSLSEEET